MGIVSLAAISLAAVPARAQFPAGPEFRVSTYTPDDQTLAAVAAGPAGDFVVVWTSRFQDGSGYGVFGQAFGEDGAARGAEFRVNSYTPGHQTLPDVAYDGRQFVVVWASEAQDGSGTGIFGQRFDRSGSRKGSEFQVNLSTPGGQFAPSVAMDQRGRFVVVWTDYLSPDPGEVRARRFDQSGPLTGEIAVNSYTTSGQSHAAIAMRPDGRFVVAWSSFGQDGSARGVFAQSFEASGAPRGGEFQVNAVSAGDQDAQGVAMAGDGRFVVSWIAGDGSNRGVFAERFDADGSRMGGELQVNTFTTHEQFFGAVAASARGDFVVTWQSYYQVSLVGVFGQRFDVNGARLGTEFQVNTDTIGQRRLPYVTMDPVGNFTAAWTSVGQDGSGSGIYAQRFGGILFPRIRVDITATPGPGGSVSDRNGVLEPGEAVTVEPYWRNVNGTNITNSGTVLSFTGPPGPAYTVPDATANYGEIPPGETWKCGDPPDCYVVGVSGARPATHWDAVMQEGVDSFLMRQVKLWDLHVGDSFTDVSRASPFYRFIETLLHNGATGGCTATEYCPAALTTRDIMAGFVLVAKEGAGYVPPACATPPLFADVPGNNPFCRFVEELFRRGVVAGCAPNAYCPADPATREQMAVFVLRTLDGGLSPPACTAPMFADVPASSPFCRWIEELARRGVVNGCAPTLYCPTGPVTREQMAVFLTVTFGLKLYG